MAQSDKIEYSVVEGWEQLPTGWAHRDVAGVAVDGKNITSIKRGGPPFNRLTNVAIGLNGDIYISDGYGNARVHIFSPKGELKQHGASRASAPASSTCRIASRSTRRTTFT